MITDEFSITIIKLKRKPNLLETEYGKKFINSKFTDFVRSIEIKSFSIYTVKEGVFANFGGIIGKKIFSENVVLIGLMN